MKQQGLRQTSLRDFYYVVFRHKWRIILFFVVLNATVALKTFLSAETYRSQAKLLIKLGRESVTLDPTAATGPIVNVSQSRRDQLNSELEIIKSRELVEKVVDTIGPQTLLGRPDESPTDGGATSKLVRKTRRSVRAAFGALRSLMQRLDLTESVDTREKAILTVTGGLDFAVASESSIIVVSYDAQCPELAQKVVATLLDEYQEKHMEVYQTSGSYEFFVQQSQQMQDELHKAENRLLEAQNTMGISSPTEERLSVLQRIASLKLQKGAVEADISAAEARIKTLQKTMVEVPQAVADGKAAGFSDHGTDLMRDRLYELQMRQESLESKYAEDSREVQMIRKEVAEAQALLDQERVNSVRKQVQLDLLTQEADLSSLAAKAKDLGSQLTAAQAELKGIDDADMKITQLTREIDVQRANYLKYVDSLEQSRIDRALAVGKISNISVVQQATLPIESIRPRKALNLAMGLLLGIIGSLGLAYSWEYLDHSIKTPEDASRRLQLPTLASIPRVSAGLLFPAETAESRKAGHKRAAKRRQRAAKGGSEAEIVERWALETWAISGRLKRYYSALAEDLLLNANAKESSPFIVAVAGYRRREGVSSVAANLAVSLARRSVGDILLVDSNTSHPIIHRVFGAKLSPGLLDVFKNGIDDGDTIAGSPVERLHILSAGGRNLDLGDIIDMDRLQFLLDSVENKCRFVVVDLPAVAETSFVPLMASLCDGVIMVVEAERSRWEAIDRMKNTFASHGTEVLGVVLNKRRFHIPNWLYRTL